MNIDEIKVTTEILWRATVLFAMIDAVLVMYLARFVESEVFRNLRLPLTIITGLFWFLVWLVMVTVFWEPVYHYVFPAWSRWIIPPVYAVFFALIGLLFWWLALRLSGNPVVNFCLLGGFWGMVTHLWAIHRGILDKPPVLQGVSPIAASIMPIAEFIFYWCIILGVAWIWHKRKQ
ncbi:MAG: hypothetical protein JW973_10835 [Bacteroidales bacterium]|nr:hypothetical protein [Bacteroidales bacterium]